MLRTAAAKLKLNFTAENVTSVFLAVMVFVFLLAVSGGGYYTIMHLKLAVFYVCCGLYFITVAAAMFYHRSTNRSWPQRFRNLWQKAVPTQKLLFLFWIFCLLSAVLSPFFPQTLWGFHRFEGLLTISCYLGCFFFISVYGKARPWLLWLFAAAVTIFCIICFLQFAALNPLWLYPEGLTYYDANDAYRYEFLGTIGNVGMVAALLAMAAPIFALALIRGKGKKRFLLLIPLLAVLAVVALAKVAAAIVAVVATALLLIPLAVVKGKRNQTIAWLLLLVLLLAGFALIFCCDLGNGTLHEFHALLHGEWDDDFGTGRLFIWRSVLAIVPERPLFGGGCDTLGERLTEGFQRYDAEKGVLYRASIDTAHNEYLNILVNEGALALLAYLAALISSFITFIRKSQTNAALAILGGGVLGYCIQAFFGIRLCVIAPLFWICWGLFTSAAISGEEEQNRLQNQ